MTAAGEAARPRGEVLVLDDVGSARRRPLHPAAAGSTALLLAAAAALVGALVLWPVVRTVTESLTDAQGRYVGTRHFQAVWRDGGGGVVARTLAWAVLVPPVVTGLGLVLAYLSRRLPGGGRQAATLLVAPVGLPLVATGVVFRLLYDPDPARGTATRLAQALPGDVVPLWLGPRLVTLALMSAFAWVWVGLALVVFRAALDRLPPGLPDVVRAYGGSRWEMFRDGRWLPVLRRTVAIVLTLVALATVRTFDLILTMAPGSVLDEASVLAVEQWNTAGAGSTDPAAAKPAAALGVMWLAVVALGVLLAAWWSRPPRRRPRASAPRVSRLDHDPAADVPGRPPRPAAAGPRSAVGGRADSRRSWLTARRVAGLAWVAAIVVWTVPIVVLVATSLHDRDAAATRGWWSPPFGLGSYARLQEVGLVGSLGLTAVLALTVTVIVLAVALLAAAALAELPPAGAQVVTVALLVAAVVPIQVVAGPVNELLDAARLAGDLAELRLVLVHVALGVPLAVVVLRNARSPMTVAQLRAVIGAAGRGRGGPVTWVRELLDAAPAVAAVFVLVFVQVWNDFFVGLLFGGSDVVPLGVRLQGETRQFVAGAGTLAAGAVLASIVPVALVVLAHRRVVDGLVGEASP